jgi:hypothetical protein
LSTPFETEIAGPPDSRHSVEPPSAGAVVHDILQHPFHFLVRHWNWKSAVTSTVFRGLIFYTTNLSSGTSAALGALETDAVYRLLTAGFYGAIIQAFRKAEPAWRATIAAALVLPAVNHLSEFFVHWLGGTPHVALGVSVSVLFTILSTVFNLFAMRRGVLVVGHGSKSLWNDFTQMPAIVAAFVACGPIALWRMVREMVLSVNNQNPGA